MTAAQTLTGERADLVQTLDGHRGFLRFTVRGLTDEQATSRTTASELNLAGLLKHVAHIALGGARQRFLRCPSAENAERVTEALAEVDRLLDARLDAQAA